MSTPYKAPMSPPPYGNDQNINQPPPAHVQSPAPGSDYYNASPYQQPGFAQSQGYPPQGPPPQGGYYDQNQYQQQGYGPQGGYPQQGYGYPQQGGYPPQGMYAQPQGQYVDRGQSSSKNGLIGACLGAMACCCCLDILF